MRDLSHVTTAMAKSGFRLESSEVGTMDSGAARYTSGVVEVSVWKDRSQWFIGDSREVLEPMGYWRAYDDVAEFCDALIQYAKTRHAEPGAAADGGA